ncbi:adenylate/guanylate cyclase domain-containing protein [Lacinutrix sp. MedPE-SW]|uniref:adenylate/guanylate cyclase domain-containing protein n=1 Tax=Lacinutrix sp. MedPE-SW TaxID=1860087 RepID=UPI0009121826|nr:adenylate/guanylate cyclase domain-containing protein [Lacinutrix sp. MedPE-SW]OIQ22644.1 MAG: adenylate/guanylate cyclase domain-containing protein [Lacinutrix sp. MedPE-SW]
MNSYVVQFLRLLLLTIVFWIIAFSIFIFIRYFAIGSEEGVIVTTYHISDILYFGVILGVLIGVIFTITEFLFDKFLSKNLSLALVLTEKFIIYLLSIILSLNYVYPLVEEALNLNISNEDGWWKESRHFWLLVGYFLVCSIIFSFIKIANEKFGSGVFFNFLIGKYRNPKEEKRIFMFLDLQASTTIAEQIGHYRYSELIQDCFYDLNRIVSKYNADIYQYVGDEAVLSWKYKTGIKKNNCVELFFHFKSRIEKKQKRYLKKYGLVPKFKAGIHGGELIVTEVGSIKKEIAYHGDVINTCARIQGECNKYNETLLCSNAIIHDLKLSSKFKTKYIGDLELKGKEETLKISAIKLN